MLGIIFCSSLAGWVPSAAAQSNAESGPANGVFAVDPATGVPGAAIPLKVRLPAPFNDASASKTAYNFLMFRGIPEGFALTSGFQTRNTWIVSISESRKLKITVPKAFQGTFYAEVFLYRGQNITPIRCAFQVRVFPKDDTLPTSANYGAIPSDTEKQAAMTPGGDKPLLSKEEEAQLFAQAEQHLKNGNVVFARLLFEELIVHGNVRGLYALAQTYDPAVLRKLGAVGLKGDAEKARELYEKAAEFAGAPAPKQDGALER
jgi:hypothetical protein